MLARDGNLYQLYREIADRVEPEMTEAARKSAAMEAEISDKIVAHCDRAAIIERAHALMPPADPLDVGSHPLRDKHWRDAVKAVHDEAKKGECGRAAWYLVQTFPLEEARAMRWLARRRFGVFQPVEQRIHHGVLVQGWQAIFPGWLLVYTWDIERMQGRICSVPGVMDLLRFPVSLEPVPIPDDFVARLREKAFDYRDSAPRRSSVGFHSERHIRRRTPRPNKKQRKELDRLKKQARDQGIGWDQSTWDNINALAPHERIAHLQRTLTQNQPAVVG